MRDAFVVTALVFGLVAVCLHTVVAQRSSPPLHIHDVNIVPTDREHVLSNSELIVQNGRISAIGSNGTLTVPDGAITIDGKGQYLIPGLWDMHVHLMPDPKHPDAFRRTLETFVKQGVTSIRVMWGWPELLEWKQRIAAGELMGPRLVVGGPIIEGEPPPELASVIHVGTRIQP
jgi:hypothetical protein